MTILEALNWGRDEINSTTDKQTTEHNSMFDAQVLLAHCLNKRTSYLFSHFEDRLSPEINNKYQDFIQRRKNFEPVAYILQKKEFYKRSFFVNRFVLIPRPETEIIIEEILKNTDNPSQIIDIGTGSGIIAVTLAKELKKQITAIDIDPDSLKVAQINARNHSVDKLISFKKGDLLSPVLNNQTSLSPHLTLIANLPYVPVKNWRLLNWSVTKFEPKNAIIAGVDGLDMYDRLLQQLSSYKKLTGTKIKLYCEIDKTQEYSLPRLIKEYFPNTEHKVIYDLQNLPRTVVANITI